MRWSCFPRVRMLSNQGFYNGGYLALLTARKLGRSSNIRRILPTGPVPRFFMSYADKFFNRDAEDFSQLLKLIGAQGDRMPFPPGICGMLHAQMIGNLLLR